MKREVGIITCKNFAEYGKVLEFTNEADDVNFEVIVREEKEPWRLAVFRVKNRKCDCLECHTTSMESFEPVSGIGVLLVAKHDTPQEYKAFLLDKAVCLNKGVWHAMITLSEESIVKIVENLEVSSEFFYLEESVTLNLN